MKYPIQQSVFTADDVAVIAPYAQVTITDSATGDPVTLWQDVDGTTEEDSNVILADATGFFRTYANEGAYDIAILSGGLTHTQRNVNVGRPSIFIGADFPTGTSAPAILFKFTNGDLIDVIARES